MRKINEECGVFGIFGNENSDVARSTYYGLYALQHRGQESCGIVVNDDGLFNSKRDNGLVNDVFTAEVLEKLGEGNIAVGHVRYGTAKTKGRANALPIVVNHIKGRMAISYNGNIINAYDLRCELEMDGCLFHTTSDAEVISYVITKERLKTGSIEEAVNKAMHSIKGAYALVVMSPSKLIACRDPHGLKPLCLGKTNEGQYVVTSESCALDATGAEFIRDVKPGEIIVIDKNGLRTIEDHVGEAPMKSCVFEYVYFARPDSVIDGVSVHKARKRAGMYLAKEFPVEADVVIGVPDSGLDAAIGYAEESGIPYGIGFLKNKYIGRTFIAPGQSVREDKVRIKLNPIVDTVKDKRVVIIDDSIVRGTTCARIIRLLRNAGAKEIHLRSSAPKFLNPCYYGTDIDSRENLIACKHTTEEICEIVGADTLGFLSVENVKKIAIEAGEDAFCTACFDNIYPTEIPKETKKYRYEDKISVAKMKENEEKK
ncbi:MAG: amidophosphoribosyltransferase [Ruminococcus sp.]|nr:amidophosphoribosyltransferase [Ruminococcus sp.]